MQPNKPTYHELDLLKYNPLMVCPLPSKVPVYASSSEEDLPIGIHSIKSFPLTRSLFGSRTPVFTIMSSVRIALADKSFLTPGSVPFTRPANQ
ncbi:Uncharacterised protein [Segatella copri]|nr:Uncharacterised protein [Segatella copri]